MRHLVAPLVAEQPRFVLIVGRLAEATLSHPLAGQRPALQFVEKRIRGDRNNRAQAET